MATYVLIGLLVQVLAPGAVLAVAYLAGKLTARWLGIPEFRVFRPGALGTRWKHLGVRCTSIAGAFLVCFLLGFAMARQLGTEHPTMTVNALPGFPARAAGVEDGDRIVAIDGKAHSDWHALRADIQSSKGDRTLTIERNGERITRVVTPRDGRIGIDPHHEQRPTSIAQAATRAFELAFAPLRHLDPRSRERVVLMGPVAFAREVKKSAPDPLGVWLGVSALYAAYTWLAVAAFHAFDALLLRFRRSND